VGAFRGVKERVGDYFRGRVVIYALVISLLAVGFGAGAVGAGSLAEADRGELTAFLSAYVRQAGAGELVSPHTGSRAVWTELARGVLVPWFLGLSVIGAPAALAFVFLRGFAIGFTVRLLVEEYALKGALLGLVSVAPHSLFSVFGICLAAGAALTFAVGAAKLMTGRAAGESVLSHFAAATLLCAVAGSSVALGAWIQENVTPILVGLALRWISL